MMQIEFTNAKDTTEQIWLEIGKIRKIEKIAANNLAKERCAVYYKKKSFLVDEPYDQVLSKLSLFNWKPMVESTTDQMIEALKNQLETEKTGNRDLWQINKMLNSTVKEANRQLDELRAEVENLTNRRDLMARTINLLESQLDSEMLKNQKQSDTIKDLKEDLRRSKDKANHFVELNRKNVVDHEKIIKNLESDLEYEKATNAASKSIIRHHEANIEGLLKEKESLKKLLEPATVKTEGAKSYPTYGQKYETLITDIKKTFLKPGSNTVHFEFAPDGSFTVNSYKSYL